MVGPCGGHARKDGRTGFSSAAPAALQPLRWPHGVLKRCTCRASTFKMAVQGSQALRLPRFNLLDGRTGSQVLRPSRVGELRVSHAQKTSPSYEVKDSDIMPCPLPHCPIVHSSRPWEPQRAVNDLAKAMKALDGKKRPWEPQRPEWSHHKLDHWHNEPEEWERNLCENKAVAILERMQAGRPALIIHPSHH